MNIKFYLSLRKLFPVVLLLIPLVLGELAAAIFPLSLFYICIFLGALCSLCFLLRRWMIFAFIFIIGFILVNQQFPRAILLEKESLKIKLRASVSDVIRHSKPDLVKFVATVERVFDDPVLPKTRRLQIRNLGRDLKNTQIQIVGPGVPWEVLHEVTEKDLVEVAGTFKLFRRTSNPFSYTDQLLRKGIVGEIQVSGQTEVIEQRTSARERYFFPLIDKIRSILGKDESVGLFLSMVFGLRDQISNERENVYKRAGLMHLLVISGYQVGIVFYFLRTILRLFYNRLIAKSSFLYGETCCDLFSLLLTLSAILLISGDSSINRAAISLILFILCSCIERGQNFFTITAVTAFIVSLIWPGCLFEPGMQLTFAALLGIAWGSYSCRSKWKQFTQVTLLVTLFTNLISIVWFGSYSLLGIILNPLLGTLGSVLFTLGGFIGAVALALSLDPLGFVLKILLELLVFFDDFVIYVVQIAGDTRAELRIFLPVYLILSCWIIATTLSVKWGRFKLKHTRA